MARCVEMCETCVAGLETLDDRLRRLYGVPRRRREDPLDALVATILSQNTNDANSGRAFRALKEAFPDWDAVRHADAAALEAALRPGGLARVKARRIQKLLGALADRGGLTLDSLRPLSVEEAEAELLRFDGVGLKTARCVLLFALGKPAFPIDTHIERVLKRMGVLPEGVSTEQAHRLATDAVPEGRHLSLHLNLIAHGRQVCHARRPDCPRCGLRDLCCFYARTQGSERPS